MPDASTFSSLTGGPTNAVEVRLPDEDRGEGARDDAPAAFPPPPSLASGQTDDEEERLSIGHGSILSSLTNHEFPTARRFPGVGRRRVRRTRE